MIVVMFAPPLLAVGITIATRLLAEPEPQTLPAPWIGIGNDDIQYFAPGPEFETVPGGRLEEGIRARPETERRASPMKVFIRNLLLVMVIVGPPLLVWSWIEIAHENSGSRWAMLKYERFRESHP